MESPRQRELKAAGLTWRQRQGESKTEGTGLVIALCATPGHEENH